MRNKLLKIIFSLLIIALSTPLTIAFLLFINGGKAKLEEDDQVKVVQFNLIKPKKNKKEEPKKNVVKKKEVVKNQKLPEIAPVPDLGSEVTGVELDLPGFENVGFDTSNKSIVGDIKEVVMTEDTVDTKPSLVKQAPLDFPKRAKLHNVSGFVLLSFMIDDKGKVKNLKIIEETPEDYGFGDSAFKCMESSIFEPATYKNKPVSLRVTYPVEMRLK